MANIATAYLVNASVLRQKEALAEQLDSALRTRRVVEHAKGMVAAHRRIPVDKAYELIRTHARANNVKVKHIAEAIVDMSLTL